MPKTVIGRGTAPDGRSRSPGTGISPTPEWHKIKEVHELWKDVVFGVKFADNLYRQEKAEPIKDVEIQWVEDAVNVAKIVGEQLGWEHAPWEDLLVDPQDGAGYALVWRAQVVRSIRRACAAAWFSRQPDDIAEGSLLARAVPFIAHAATPGKLPHSAGSWTRPRRRNS